MSSLPAFTIRDLMDAGVHFGHKTMRWNPKMAPFIFGEKNNIHIIDLGQTAPLLHRALKAAYDVASKNGRILFVSTKRQGSDVVAEQAQRCGQYYVNFRWLGGMLTNWGTVSQSINTLRDIEAQLADEEIDITKKERLTLTRKLQKLENSLGGIKDMGGTPDLVFVIDTNKEHIAIKEANKLGIPVIAVADTNSDPAGIDHIIPGNDDSVRSIELYAKLIADAALAGLGSALGGKQDNAKPAAEKEEKELKVVKKEAKKLDKKEEEAAAEGVEDAPKEASA